MSGRKKCGSSEEYQSWQNYDRCAVHLEKEICLGRLSWFSLLVGVGLFISISILTHAIIFGRNLRETPERIKELKPDHQGPVLSQNENEKVISCYYNYPEESNKEQLFPSNIDPHLCTHINVAFATIKYKKIFIDESMNKTLLEIIHLKSLNCKLKILLSVGGAGSHNGFSEMVVTHASRKIFIRSLKLVLRKYSLDGVDLDWEFPAFHRSKDVSLMGRERQHFSQLLREIKMEFIREKRNYILTVATASPEIIVNVSYDVDQINMYADYVNIMTYDYHYYTKYTPFTGFNSPLYPRPSENLYLATLNINYTINMYISKGLDKHKIVVGVPTYGHTFTLVNVNNGDVGSPASGYGSLGHSGFVNYPEVSTYLMKNNNTAQVKYEEAARVPYAHVAGEWLSYEDLRSVAEKANYVTSMGLRGVMIYSLNADDYMHGFPLARSVRINMSDSSPLCSEARR